MSISLRSSRERAKTGFRKRSDRPLDHAKGGQELAYRLVDETRLYCEQLQAESRHGSALAALHDAHRELGMGACMASAEISPAWRMILLADAHRRTTRSARRLAKVGALVKTATLAEDAVVEELAGWGHTGHLHLAHLHVLRALEILGGQL